MKGNKTFLALILLGLAFFNNIELIIAIDSTTCDVQGSETACVNVPELLFHGCDSAIIRLKNGVSGDITRVQNYINGRKTLRELKIDASFMNGAVNDIYDLTNSVANPSKLQKLSLDYVRTGTDGTHVQTILNNIKRFPNLVELSLAFGGFNFVSDLTSDFSASLQSFPSLTTLKLIFRQTQLSSFSFTSLYLKTLLPNLVNLHIELERTTFNQPNFYRLFKRDSDANYPVSTLRNFTLLQTTSTDLTGANLRSFLAHILSSPQLKSFNVKLSTIQAEAYAVFQAFTDANIPFDPKNSLLEEIYLEPSQNYPSSSHDSLNINNICNLPSLKKLHLNLRNWDEAFINDNFRDSYSKCTNLDELLIDLQRYAVPSVVSTSDVLKIIVDAVRAMKKLNKLSLIFSQYWFKPSDFIYFSNELGKLDYVTDLRIELDGSTISTDNLELFFTNGLVNFIKLNSLDLSIRYIGSGFSPSHNPITTLGSLGIVLGNFINLERLILDISYNPGLERDDFVPVFNAIANLLKLKTLNVMASDNNLYGSVANLGRSIKLLRNLKYLSVNLETTLATQTDTESFVLEVARGVYNSLEDLNLILRGIGKVENIGTGPNNGWNALLNNLPKLQNLALDLGTDSTNYSNGVSIAKMQILYQAILNSPFSQYLRSVYLKLKGNNNDASSNLQNFVDSAQNLPRLITLYVEPTGDNVGYSPSDTRKVPQFFVMNIN